MKILITGGAGMIGSHLADALIKNNTVIIIDNLSNGRIENIKRLLDFENCHFYKIDINQVEEVEKIFERHDIDYIFHMAANSDIKFSSNNPQIEVDNTFFSTYHVLEYMRKYGIRKMFFASTSAVYGKKEGRCKEDDELVPISYYGACKKAAEGLIQAYSHCNNFDCTIFRFANVIGPRLTHGVVYDFINKLVSNGKVLEILGDGKQNKPYIYVDDLIDAIQSIVFNNRHGTEIYNVGVRTNITVDEIANIVCKALKLENVNYDYKGGKEGWVGDISQFSFNIDKALACGWKPKLESKQAVEKSVEKYLELVNGEIK